MAKNSTLNIEWQALEHEHKKRSSDWFWAAGIITIAIAVVSIIVGNIIFAVLVILSAFSLGMFINKEPQKIRVSINELGLQCDKTLYPFETLENFWIDIEHPHKKIILKSKKVLMPLIIVPIADEANFEEIRENLLAHLKEEYHSLPFMEKVLEYLGF